MNFLTVGHTHEDIDAIFALLLSRVLKRVRFQSPEELIGFIDAGLKPHFEQKKEQFWVNFLDHVYDYAQWMKPLCIHLFNAFVTREGIDAPHSFAFKARRSCSERELQSAIAPIRSGRRGGVVAEPEHLDDVFCIPKRFMRSEQTLQPVCVLTSDRVHHLLSPGPTVQKRKEAMTLRRCTELRQLASQLETLTGAWGPAHSYYRGAAALRALAHGSAGTPMQHSLLWSNVGRALTAPSTQNPFFSTLPEMSWQLLARFQRLAG